MNAVKNIILDFFKGIAIGIANVIPGFSGGTMAVILKIYERLINGFSQIAKKPLKVIKDLWSVILGLIAGVLIAIVTIVKLLDAFPLPTLLFFIGLVLGALPDIYKEYNSKEKFHFINVITFLIAILIIVILPLITTSSKQVVEIDFWLILILFIMGAIAASAMIIPGVSGSMVLMIFGYYFCVTDSISSFIESILVWNTSTLLFNFWILLSFGIGCIVGLLFISKLISFLFNKYPRSTYAFILGLLIASPFAMLFSGVKDYPTLFNFNIWIYLSSLITLVSGLFITLFLSKLGTKNE